jgi:hypothetical protein
MKSVYLAFTAPISISPSLHLSLSHLHCISLFRLHFISPYLAFTAPISISPSLHLSLSRLHFISLYLAFTASLSISPSLHLHCTYLAFTSSLSISPSLHLSLSRLHCISLYLAFTSSHSFFYLLFFIYLSLSVPQSNPRSVCDHREIVLSCLTDDDITIRTRALELLAGIVSRKSLVDLVHHLLQVSSRFLIYVRYVVVEVQVCLVCT